MVRAARLVEERLLSARIAERHFDECAVSAGAPLVHLIAGALHLGDTTRPDALELIFVVPGPRFDAVEFSEFIVYLKTKSSI